MQINKHLQDCSAPMWKTTALGRNFTWENCGGFANGCRWNKKVSGISCWRFETSCQESRTEKHLALALIKTWSRDLANSFWSSWNARIFRKLDCWGKALYWKWPRVPRQPNEPLTKSACTSNWTRSTFRTAWRYKVETQTGVHRTKTNSGRHYQGAWRGLKATRLRTEA